MADVIYDENGNPVQVPAGPPPAPAAPPVFSPGAFVNRGGISTGAAAVAGGYVAPPPDLQPLESPLDPDTFPGTEGSSGAGRAGASGAAMEATAKAVGAGYLPTGGELVGPTVMPGYNDFSGMPEGRSSFEHLQDRRKDISDAIDEGSRQEEKMGQQRADVLEGEINRQKEENATLAQHRQERMVGEQARQAQVDAAVDKYSRDLADTGQFWRNPGNIMAAMGAAMMALGGKAELGAQLVQNAINTDLSQRKHLADMHLGELRSNVAAYRQLEGDKEAGDLRASIESKKIAMMELDRISAQFQGPLAKQKNIAIKAQLQRGLELEEIQLHYMRVNNKPGFINPAIKNEYARMGKALPTGVGPTPVGGGTINKPNTGVETIPNASGTAVPVGPKTGSGPLTSAHVSATLPSKIVSDDGLTDAQAVELDKRFPGTSSRLRTAEKTNRADVLAKIGANPDLAGLTKTQMLPYLTEPQRKAYNSAMLDVRNKIDAEYEKASQKLLPIAGRIDGFKMMKRDMDIMQVVANKISHGDPDKLLNPEYEKIFGASNVSALADYMSVGKPTDAHKAQAKEISDAVNRFKQMRAGVVSTYFKEKFGAVTNSDEARGNQTIPVGASWNATKSFLETGSSAAQSEADAIVNGIGNPLAQTIWQVRLGTNNHTLNVGAIDGPTTKQNPYGQGNTGSNHSGPSRKKAVPSSQDPEVRKRAIEKLDPAARKLLGG